MKRMLLITLLAAIALLAAVQPSLSCRSQSPPAPRPATPPIRSATPQAQKDLPIVRMRLGDRIFTLEVARTDRSREIGLMHRDSMPADHGMIFVFPEAHRLGFWMRNTRFPLDIVYVAPDQRIVSIHRMEPFDENSTLAAGAALWAIELNAGTASALGLKPGQLLEIPPDAMKALD